MSAAEADAAELERLRRYIDDAGDGANLVGLLDLYYDETESLRATVAELEVRAAAEEDLAVKTAQRADDAERQLRAARKAYKALVKALRDLVPTWAWSDPYCDDDPCLDDEGGGP